MIEVACSVAPRSSFAKTRLSSTSPLSGTARCRTSRASSRRPIVPKAPPYSRMPTRCCVMSPLRGRSPTMALLRTPP